MCIILTNYTSKYDIKCYTSIENETFQNYGLKYVIYQIINSGYYILVTTVCYALDNDLKIYMLFKNKFKGVHNM